MLHNLAGWDRLVMIDRPSCFLHPLKNVIMRSVDDQTSSNLIKFIVNGIIIFSNKFIMKIYSITSLMVLFFIMTVMYRTHVQQHEQSPSS